MKLIAHILALSSLFFAGQAAAQATTYTFTGGLYDTVNNSANCTVGECATYTTAQRTVITLTFAAPLAADLPLADRSAAVTAYSLNDGVTTTTGPAANAAMRMVLIGTDATGTINNYTLWVDRTPGPPYLSGTPADPNSRVSGVFAIPSFTQAFGNYVCGARGPNGAVSGPGSCTAITNDASSSVAESSTATVVTTTVVAPIPTLSEWAMILFGAMLAGGAALYIQRQRFAA